jgi:hypothetical protein
MLDEGEKFVSQTTTSPPEPLTAWEVMTEADGSELRTKYQVLAVLTLVSVTNGRTFIESDLLVLDNHEWPEVFTLGDLMGHNAEAGGRWVVLPTSTPADELDKALSTPSSIPDAKVSKPA